MSGVGAAASLACLRFRRLITLHDCDKALLEWDAADEKDACGGCPYNPLLDAAPTDPSAPER